MTGERADLPSLARKMFVGAMLLALVACTAGSVEDYEARLERWREGGPQDYVWTVEWSEPVYGPRLMTVRVDGGEPRRAVVDGQRVPIEGDSANGVPATVEALIRWLLSSAPDARAVEVEWDQAGYPSRIGMDGSDAIDDEISFRVVAFEPEGATAASPGAEPLPPEALPVPEPVPWPIEPGLARDRPESHDAPVGEAQPFQLYTHCGVDFRVDFDGSFWQSYAYVGDAPADPFQRGTMTLLAEDVAVFEMKRGAVIYFVRNDSPKPTGGCF